MPAKKLPVREVLERKRIGATIRAIREAKRLTADQVANRVSETRPFGRPYFMNIEAGRRGLPQYALEPLAEALGCDPGAIVRDDYYQAEESSEDDDLEDAA